MKEFTKFILKHSKCEIDAKIIDEYTNIFNNIFNDAPINEEFIRSLNDKNLCYLIGLCYNKKNNQTEMEKYFSIAIENNCERSARYLGNYYSYNQNRNTSKALEYYIIAHNNGCTTSVNDIVLIFKNKKEYDKIEKYVYDSFKRTEDNRYMFNFYDKEEAIITNYAAVLAGLDDSNNRFTEFISRIYPTLSENLKNKYYIKILTIINHHNYLLHTDLINSITIFNKNNGMDTLGSKTDVSFN